MSGCNGVASTPPSTKPCSTDSRTDHTDWLVLRSRLPDEAQSPAHGADAVASSAPTPGYGSRGAPRRPAPAELAPRCGAAAAGIRIYESTPLEKIAYREGVLAEGQDLFDPAHHVSATLGDDPVATVDEIARQHPEWSSSADLIKSSSRAIQDLINRQAHALNGATCARVEGRWENSRRAAVPCRGFRTTGLSRTRKPRSSRRDGLQALVTRPWRVRTSPTLLIGTDQLGRLQRGCRMKGERVDWVWPGDSPERV